MNKPPRIAAVVLLSMFLFGCGQSGPLYVSGNPSNVEANGENSTNEEDDEQDAESSTDK